MYRLLIFLKKEVNRKVFKIKNKAYDCSGNTMKNYYSLHYFDKHIKDDRSISMKRFWDIYHKLKTENGSDLN